MHAPTRTLLAALALLGACSEPAPPPETLIVHLDERPVLLGRVREAIASPTTDEVYVELELASGERRWVVLDGGAGPRAHPGAWLRVRSLARRSHVWVREIERDFDSLDYVAIH